MKARYPRRIRRRKPGSGSVRSPVAARMLPPTARIWVTESLAPTQPLRIEGRSWPRRLALITGGLLSLGFAVAFLTGCMPAAMMAGANLLSGTQSLAASGTKAPYAGRGSTVQNGRTDPTIAQALKASDREITDECRDRVRDKAGKQPGGSSRADSNPVGGETVITKNGPACILQERCLPGFRQPVILRLCRPSSSI